VKESEFAKMHRAEQRFWWFVGKGRLVKDLAEQWLDPGGVHLDAGCGTGANLELLGDSGTWLGLDYSAEALRWCADRGRRGLVLGDCGRLPFPDRSFAGAAALDLLEHLPDDAAAAAELHRVLKPGGRLLVTVPAHPFLWGSHDRALGHHRRYRKAELMSLLSRGGFHILRIDHFMGLLFPAMLAVRLLQRADRRDPDTISYDWPESINRLLLGIVDLERRLFKWRAPPFGTTLVAVAQKV
jgi:SAM-dependent methyltransferase